MSETEQPRPEAPKEIDGIDSPEVRKKLILAGCIIMEGDTILLLHRIKTDWYELPGGKINKGESPKDAAIREIKEELSCEAESLEDFGQQDFIEGGHTMTYHWFKARIKAGQFPRIGEPEKFNGFKYIKIAKLSTYHLSPNMKNLATKLK